MSNINISELILSESFLGELTSEELEKVTGGVQVVSFNIGLNNASVNAAGDNDIDIDQNIDQNLDVDVDVDFDADDD